MRKLFAEPVLQVGLAGDGVAALLPGRLQVEGSFAAPWSVADALAMLENIISERWLPRCALRVVLADRWARYFFVTPPQNAGGLADCRAAAALRFQSLYGEAADAWEIEAAWQIDAPFLACALPATLTQGLAALAGRHRMRLQIVQPHFIAAWNRWSAHIEAGSWFGLLHEAQLVLGMLQQGRLCAMQALDVPRAAGAAWLATTLQREALRHGLDQPAGLQLAGALPSAWKDGCRRLDYATIHPQSAAHALLTSTGAAS